MLSFTCEGATPTAIHREPTGGSPGYETPRNLGWSAARYHLTWCCSAPFHPIRKIIRGAAGVQRWGRAMERRRSAPRELGLVSAVPWGARRKGRTTRA